jgi:RNA polymerase sigma-70 factor (ECF subfamily)
LKDQDRSLWDHGMIAEASVLIESSLRSGPTRSYQIQAAIAGLHSLAPSFEETDWPQIVVLYRLLEAVQPTPVVRVNRVVAEAEVSGPEAALDLLSSVSGLERWHLYWSVKADLHRRANQPDLSADAYRAALECDMNDTDRKFLELRLQMVIGLA